MVRGRKKYVCDRREEEESSCRQAEREGVGDRAGMEQGRWKMAGPAQGTQSKAICRWGARLLLALATDDADSGSTSPPGDRKKEECGGPGFASGGESLKAKVRIPLASLLPEVRRLGGMALPCSVSSWVILLPEGRSLAE